MKTSKSNKKAGSIMDLAGAWKDLSEEDFKRIKDAIKRSRKSAS